MDGICFGGESLRRVDNEGRLDPHWRAASLHRHQQEPAGGFVRPWMNEAEAQASKASGERSETFGQSVGPLDQNQPPPGFQERSCSP